MLGLEGFDLEANFWPWRWRALALGLCDRDWCSALPWPPAAWCPTWQTLCDDQLTTRRPSIARTRPPSQLYQLSSNHTELTFRHTTVYSNNYSGLAASQAAAIAIMLKLSPYRLRAQNKLQWSLLQPLMWSLHSPRCFTIQQQEFSYCSDGRAQYCAVRFFAMQ